VVKNGDMSLKDAYDARAKYLAQADPDKISEAGVTQR
jgi:hypothetical protein